MTSLVRAIPSSAMGSSWRIAKAGLGKPLATSQGRPPPARLPWLRSMAARAGEALDKLSALISAPAGLV
jgi:hypothetical protein